MNQIYGNREFVSVNKSDNKVDQHIISLAFIFGLFMPNGNLFYYLVPIITLLLTIRYYKYKNSLSVQYLILLLIFISFFQFAFTKSGVIDNKTFLRNAVLIQLILFFPFAKDVKIPNFYLYFALFYIFISQVSYITGISSVISFFNNSYPYEGDFYLYQSDFLQSKAQEMSLTNRSLRLGGLFHNSNQCARYLTILLAVFIIENFNSSFKSKLPFLLIFSLSIVGTGSRTGFFISAVIMVYYMYLKSSRKKNLTKYLYGLLIISVVVIFLYIINSGVASDLRFFDYKEGLEKSLFVKVKILFNYLSTNISIGQLLFGNFGNEGFYAIQFDSEWGELIFRYGISMILAFAVFYVSVFRKMTPTNRLFLIILFWVVSSTLILSYRAGFIFMLLLSKYYSSSLQTKRMQKIR